WYSDAASRHAGAHAARRRDRRVARRPRDHGRPAARRRGRARAPAARAPPPHQCVRRPLRLPGRVPRLRDARAPVPAAERRRRAAPAAIVATVPHGHMFGFEMTILLPLRAAVAVHSGTPLYPGDVRAALESVPAPRLLITSPVHLRALAGAALPAIERVVSA